MCYSALQGEQSFGKRLSLLTGLPVKYYPCKIIVRGDPDEVSTALFKLRRHASYDAEQVVKKVNDYGFFEILKTNPYTVGSSEYNAYEPFSSVMFYPN